jgi:hypothetical protein
MAKKQKRSVPSNRPAVSNGSAVTERPAPATATSTYTPRATTFASSRSTYSAEFNPDYSLVVRDLKRIGIMAGSFTVLLVVLSFFLR